MAHKLLGRRLYSTGSAATVASSLRGCCAVIPASGTTSASLQKRMTKPSAEAIAAGVNWAYRGKHANGDGPAAWTGERHLLSGVRTSSADITALLQRSAAFGADETLLLAVATQPCKTCGLDMGLARPEYSCACGLGVVQVPASKAEVEDDVEDTEKGLLGVVHLQKCGESDDPAGNIGVAVEIGMLCVDPDLQGQGIGAQVGWGRHARTYRPAALMLPVLN